MLTLLLLSVTLLGTLTIGILVWIKGRRSTLHILFGLLNLSVALWALANYFSLHGIGGDQVVLFWIRSTMFLAVMQSLFFFLFIHTFPSHRLLLKKTTKRILFSFSFVTAVLTFSPFVFSHLTRSVEGAITPVASWGMAFFIPNSIGLLIAGIIILVQKLRKATGVERRQLNYVLTGSVLMFAMLVFFNFVLVNIFKNSDFVDFGALFVLPFIFFTAYAMVRFKLMDIRLVFTRSLVFALLVLYVTAAFTFLSLFVSSFFTADSTFSRMLSLGVTSFAIVVILDPLKRLLAKITDRLFFKADIDYADVTKRVTAIINRELELNRLVSSFLIGLASELRIESASILLDVGGGKFLFPDELYKGTSAVSNLLITKKQQNDFQSSSLLKHLISGGKDIVLIDEVDRLIRESVDEKSRKFFGAVRQDLEQFSAYAVIPVQRAEGSGLEAIVLLTKKKSGDSYGSKDTQLFQVLGPQLATAIQKASLYQEAKDFGNKLEREVKKAVVELKSANEKLKELDTAKSEFMSIASHQLRTPLAGIMGYLSMITDGDYGKINPEQKPVIEDVLEATKRLIRMVNIFLNATRIEAGRFVMNYKKVPFEDVIEAIYKELKPTATAKGVKLTYKKTKLGNAEVDVDKIKDVILNLTDNAIKYSPDGSVVITAERVKKNMHVMVTDSGVGIAEGEAKNLFEKFVRGSGIARVEPNGSGLGLFIAKKITEGHGGRIWAESEGDGKGSTFQFEIPLKADTTAKKKSAEFMARAKKK